MSKHLRLPCSSTMPVCGKEKPKIKYTDKIRSESNYNLRKNEDTHTLKQRKNNIHRIRSDRPSQIISRHHHALCLFGGLECRMTREVRSRGHRNLDLMIAVVGLLPNAELSTGTQELRSTGAHDPRNQENRNQETRKSRKPGTQKPRKPENHEPISSETRNQET